MDQSKPLKCPELMKRFRERIDEFERLKCVMDQLDDNLFKTAEICLSVGAGFGQSEIEFINRCLPKLKRFIAIEKNHDCVVELEVNLKNTFGDKLQVEIHEMSIENFMKNGDNWKSLKDIDVVVSFHFLHYISHSDRVNFFKLCFGSWLKPETGLLVLTNVSKEHSVVRIHEELQPYVEPFVHCELLKDELKMMKLVIGKDIPIDGTINYNEFGKDLHRMFAQNQKAAVTEEMIDKAVKVVAPSGVGKYAYELIVVENRRIN